MSKEWTSLFWHYWQCNTSTVLLPGTVEVYANGALIGRRELAAGPFTLEQLGIQPDATIAGVIISVRQSQRAPPRAVTAARRACWRGA